VDLGASAPPPDLQALLAAAIAHDQAGRYAEAAEAYRAYLERDPFQALAWTDLGGVLRMLGDIDGAERACRKALALSPGLPSALVNLAFVVLHRGRLAEAEALARQALAGAPESVEALIALADVHVATQAHTSAREALECALALDPGSEAARSRLLNVRFYLHDWAGLRSDAESELEGPSAEVRRYELSRWQLLFGEFREGWKGHECRFQVPRLKLHELDLHGPRWSGEPFPGKTLLIHREQGLGDTLFLLRYLPWVKARGGRVVLVVQPELAALAATCPGVDVVVPEGAPHPPYDLHAFLFSLPSLFQSDLETLPRQVPYLRVPAEVPHRTELAEAFRAAGSRLRIGLVWAGNPAYGRDADRSISGPAWATLGDLPEVAWYALQLGREDAPDLPGLTHLGPLLGSFADTAFALRELDLLISVDTSVAHLAGALAVPTFLLLPCLPDWRWLLERTDSPWYPHHRLYRQPLPGHWAEVFAQLKADLTGGEP